MFDKYGMFYVFMSYQTYQFYSANEKTDDYSEVFGLQKDTNGFSVVIPNGFSVEYAVESKYGSEIELQGGSEINSDLCYFVITVSSGESFVDLRFNFTYPAISLDPPQIIF